MENITLEDLAKKVAERNVYDTMRTLSANARSYRGGGAANHRVYGMGCLADTYVRKVDDGEIEGITQALTFDQLRALDATNYHLMLQFMQPLFRLGLAQ